MKQQTASQTQNQTQASPLIRGGILQRKCACGQHTVAGGECAECRKKRGSLQHKATITQQPNLGINPPNDRFEQEADRIADSVVRGTSAAFGGTTATQTTLQRQEEAGKQKSNEEEFKEAAKKVGKAFLKTQPGKQIKKKAVELGESFISTLPGQIITGTAAVGAITALVATNSELPIQLPAIPLDSVAPGLSMKITYEGPVRNPTKAMITFSGKLGGPRHEGGGPTQTRTERLREENMRRQRELHEFRESLKSPEEKARDEEMMTRFLMQRINDPMSPIHIPGLTPREAAPTNEQKRKEEEVPLQRKASSHTEPEPAPPIVHEVLRSSGQPLDEGTRSFMEGRFGQNFSGVRVHTDAKAAESARAVNALAYTVGRDVVFNRGQYAPSTVSGKRLLAHELTHVVQQANVRGGISHQGLFQRQRGDSIETEKESTESIEQMIEMEQEAKQAEKFLASEPKDPRPGLRYKLNQEGKAPLWSLLEGKTLTLTPPVSLPQLLPTQGLDTKEHQPFKVAFGPLMPDEAIRTLPYVKEKPDWFTEMLRPREVKESAWDLWIVYENDGSGIIPNFGSGSDQGRTAALYLFATFNRKGTGLSRVGLTGIEMVTPRGILPQGVSVGSESTYQTPVGPYSGILAVDIGVTVYRSGNSKVDFISSVGVDSREWGKLVQDFIHKKVSNSPVFPWPEGTKPLLEGGVTWNHTINDLTSSEFAGLKYSGHLELDTKALVGTRRAEGTLGARFVVRTAEVNTPIGAISAEYSPVGILARGFVRYNDGRVGILPGIEGGISTSVMVNIGKVGVGLVGEAIMSTDPAFQTPNPAGTGPAALDFGTVSSAPFGHHGTGQLVLRFGF